MSGEMIQGLVSIMMPAYNAAHFIGKAIESVISQTYTNSVNHRFDKRANFGKVKLLNRPNQRGLNE